MNTLTATRPLTGGRLITQFDRRSMLEALVAELGVKHPKVEVYSTARIIKARSGKRTSVQSIEIRKRGFLPSFFRNFLPGTVIYQVVIGDETVFYRCKSEDCTAFVKALQSFKRPLKFEGELFV